MQFTETKFLTVLPHPFNKQRRMVLFKRLAANILGMTHGIHKHHFGDVPDEGSDFFLIAIGETINLIQQILCHFIAEAVEDILFDVQVNHLASFRVQIPVMFLRAPALITQKLMVSTTVLSY